MKLFGILLAINALVITAWYVTGDGQHKAWAISICSIAIFFSAFLILHDRAIEFSINKVGTIKAAAQEAVIDAQEISKIRQRVENQSATIDIVANKAHEVDLKLQETDKTLLFQRTIFAAQNDDRKSFDQLKIWSKDLLFPYHAEAEKQWQFLNDNPQEIDGIRDFMRLPVEQCADILNDKTKKPLKELIAMYYKIPPSQARFMKCHVIIYIADKRTDLPKKERLAFLISIIQSDTSFAAAWCAGWRFWGNTVPSEEWLNKEAILSFWEANKEKY